MKLTRNLMRGQSLIEVLVAFGVVVMVGMALITASLATQRTSISARNKSQATELAQQYLEQVRVIRDIKGFSYIPTVNDSCRYINFSMDPNPSMWTLNNTCPQASPPCNAAISSLFNGELVSLNNINYCRKITFTVLTTLVSTKAVVTVAWKEGVNDRSISNETIISKWCGGAVQVDGTICPP